MGLTYVVSHRMNYSYPSFLRYPTGGNSLHAVRCVNLLNTQLAANQVTNLAIATLLRP